MAAKAHVLTEDQAVDFTVALAARDIDRATEILIENDVAPAFVLSLLIDLVVYLLRKVTGHERLEPDEMWILQPVAGSCPPAAAQLLTAALNGDEAMIQAHINAICAGDERSVSKTVAQVMVMTIDVIDTLRRQGASDS